MVGGLARLLCQLRRLGLPARGLQGPLCPKVGLEAVLLLVEEEEGVQWSWSLRGAGAGGELELVVPTQDQLWTGGTQRTKEGLLVQKSLGV